MSEAMKWATYRGDDGDRVGVLTDESIYSRAAADEALRHPSEVVRVDEVRLRAPIPTPPSIRDSLCFLDHMRNCQQAMGGGRVLKDTWYRIPAFYFACPSTVLGPYDDAPMAPGSAWQDFELEIAAVIGVGGKD